MYRPHPPSLYPPLPTAMNKKNEKKQMVGRRLYRFHPVPSVVLAIPSHQRRRTRPLPTRRNGGGAAYVERRIPSGRRPLPSSPSTAPPKSRRSRGQRPAQDPGCRNLRQAQPQGFLRWYPSPPPTAHLPVVASSTAHRLRRRSPPTPALSLFSTDASL